MKVFAELSAANRRNLLVLGAAGLLFWSSLGSLLPTLPLYVEKVGGSKQDVGIVMGAFAIGLLLFRVVLGKLADQRSRKLVVLIGVIVAAIAPLGFIFLTSIPLLIALRAFHGISIAAFTTGYSALVVDLSPPKQRGELIGYMSLVQPIGVAAGPALGGFLQEGLGYTALFVCSSILGFLALLTAWQVQEATQEPRLRVNPTTIDPPTNTFWQLISSPRLWTPSMVLLLIGLGFGTLTTFVPLYIKETQVPLNPGLFYTAAALASFSSRILLGRASDRYGRGIFITASLISYGLAMGIISQAQSATVFLLGAALEGLGAGTLLPMMIALISDRSRPQERGQVFAICIGGFDVGIALAGPLLGAVAEPLGYRGLFAIASSLSLLACLLFLTRSSKTVGHSLRFALGREKDLYALEQSP